MINFNLTIDPFPDYEEGSLNLNLKLKGHEHSFYSLLDLPLTIWDSYNEGGVEADYDSKFDKVLAIRLDRIINMVELVCKDSLKQFRNSNLNMVNRELERCEQRILDNIIELTMGQYIESAMISYISEIEFGQGSSKYRNLNLFGLVQLYKHMLDMSILPNGSLNLHTSVDDDYRENLNNYILKNNFGLVQYSNKLLELLQDFQKWNSKRIVLEFEGI